MAKKAKKTKKKVKTFKVEFIKAYEDGFWKAEVLDVPEGAVTWGCTCDDGKKGKPISFDNPHWDAAVIAWAQDFPGQDVNNRKVVYWGIYNSDPGLDGFGIDERLKGA